MLRIRLSRVGKKKQPSYRIVVADVGAPRDGKVVDRVGTYNPLTDPPTVVLDAERAAMWLRRGAQPSEPVQRLLRSHGLLEKASTLEKVGTNEGTG